MSSAATAQIQSNYQKALALQRAGQGEAALALLTAIVLQRPQTAEAHFQIGRIHAAAGRHSKAKASLLQALRYRPAEEAIWKALAEVTPDADRDALSTEIAATLPPEHQARYGTSLRREQRYNAAETVLLGAVEAGAEMARLPLAHLYQETCRVEEAEKVLRGANPKSAEIWYHLALMQARLRDVEAAQSAMRRSVKAGADPAPAAIELSSTLAKEGETGAAEAVLAEAIKIKPRGMLYGKRGQLAQSAGRIEAARADLLRAIELDPKDGEAYRSYFAAEKVRADDPVLARCEAALADPSLPPDARSRMHFAMAKALSDLGRHDEVFGHLHEANGLQQKEYPFDFELALSWAKANLRTVRAHLQGREPAGAAGQVIFVAGLPRSGTTLIETILAAHPMVAAGGELTFMVDALKPVAERIERRLDLSPQDFAEPGVRYLRAARRRLGGAEIFTDKSVAIPQRIGLAAYALPEARFILPRRDPRDIGLSMYRNMFGQGTQRYTTDLFSIGRMIRLHEAMVAAWTEILPDRIHLVDYEALTAEPEPHIRALVAATGLPWDEACLAPHRAERQVETLSFAQVRQPIYRSSVAGWKRYEAELGPLEEGLALPVHLD